VFGFRGVLHFDTEEQGRVRRGGILRPGDGESSMILTNCRLTRVSISKGTRTAYRSAPNTYLVCPQLFAYMALRVLTMRSV
jgi:hypothetical protein